MRRLLPRLRRRRRRRSRYPDPDRLMRVYTQTRAEIEKLRRAA